MSHGHDSAVRILRHVPPIARCVDTGKVCIGRAYVPPPARIVSRDAVTLQTALLDERTAQQPSTLARLAGAIWRLA